MHPPPTRSGLAAIFMEDAGATAGPEPEPPRKGIADAARAALDHTVFLVTLWAAAVASKQLILTGTCTIFRHALKVLLFAASYFVIDLVVALQWPDMTENLVQAGLFHIATVMFSCLPETAA
eukprot:jgi/Tetstr1/454173/TSEL_041092.t1